MSRWASCAVAAAVLVIATPAGAQAPAGAPPEPMVLPVEAMELPVQTLDGSVERTRTRVTLQADVLFAFGSARLTERARTRIASAAAEVRRRAPARLVVTGHTDSRGLDGFNLRLSRQRAASVQRALTAALGAEAPPVVARGRGEADPVAANTAEDGTDSPKGRAQNRRVELGYG